MVRRRSLPARVRYTREEKAELPSLLTFLIERSLATHPDGTYIVYTGFSAPIFKGTSLHFYTTGSDESDRVGTLRCIGHWAYTDGGRNYLFRFDHGPRFSPTPAYKIAHLAQRMEWNYVRTPTEDTPDSCHPLDGRVPMVLPPKEQGRKKGTKWGKRPKTLTALLKADRPNENELAQIDEDLSNERGAMNTDPDDEYVPTPTYAPDPSPVPLASAREPVDIDAALHKFRERHSGANV